MLGGRATYLPGSQGVFPQSGACWTLNTVVCMSRFSGAKEPRAYCWTVRTRLDGTTNWAVSPVRSDNQFLNLTYHLQELAYYGVQNSKKEGKLSHEILRGIAKLSKCHNG